MSERPHSRFHDRVWIEREVIGVVNRGLIYQLHGLSNASIDAWSLNLDSGSEDHRAILAAVREIAHRTRLHVDTSRDVFDDEGIPEISSIERLVIELQMLLPTLPT